MRLLQVPNSSTNRHCSFLAAMVYASSWSCCYQPFTGATQSTSNPFSAAVLAGTTTSRSANPSARNSAKRSSAKNVKWFTSKRILFTLGLWSGPTPFSPLAIPLQAIPP